MICDHYHCKNISFMHRWSFSFIFFLFLPFVSSLLSPFSFFLSPHSPSYISLSFSLTLFVFSIISFMMSSFHGLNSSALVQILIFWLRCRSLLAAPAPGTAGFTGSERRSPAGLPQPGSEWLQCSSDLQACWLLWSCLSFVQRPGALPNYMMMTNGNSDKAIR